MRLRFTQLWLAGVRAQAGVTRAGVRAWSPLISLIASFRPRDLRLILLIAVPVLAGWPLLFCLVASEHQYRGWLQAIAVPWWIVLGVSGFMTLAARMSADD